MHALRALLVAGLVACVLPAHAERTPRLIVKLAPQAAKAGVRLQERVERASAGLGVHVVGTRAMATGAQVVALDRPLDLADAERLAADVAAQPGVLYAMPDRLAHALRVANDEFATGLGYLRNGPTSIHANAAWDVTRGSPRVTVAVVDTGIRPHADLAGRILPGYDFIFDPGTSNDGDGRDPDASDAGDYATESTPDCPAHPSSWHGTAVSGVIAADTNNQLWTAGIDWYARILPVRVLGKCGGYLSDIADGIAWAAGVAVPGVPANPTPAQVINLCLGGTHGCDQAYQDAIDAALARGITRAIVVAAGNDGADSSGTAPANCAGVISVASTTSTGNLTRYSNFGPLITVSAPGGQYNPRAGTEGIVVLTNAGTLAPGADSFKVDGGTSLAAPMVSGTVSLMLSLAPDLGAAQVHDILVATAQPFVAGSTCSTAICGAGTVNADAAVRAAQALAPAPTTVTVAEYYNPALDHYFITWLDAEQQNLDAGRTPTRWTRTGYAFDAWLPGHSGTSPVCRYYIPPALGDSHFFGRGTDECDETGRKNPSLVLEDPAFMQMMLPQAGACPAGTLPIYRVFSNRADANHRYLTDRATRDAMVAQGWLAEGDGLDQVVMCAAP
jgi:serine protease